MRGTLASLLEALDARGSPAIGFGWQRHRAREHHLLLPSCSRRPRRQPLRIRSLLYDAEDPAGADHCNRAPPGRVRQTVEHPGHPLGHGQRQPRGHAADQPAPLHGRFHDVGSRKFEPTNSAGGFSFPVDGMITTKAKELRPASRAYGLRAEMTPRLWGKRASATLTPGIGLILELDQPAAIPVVDAATQK